MEIRLFGFKIYLRKSAIAVAATFVVIILGIFLETISSGGETVSLTSNNASEKISRLETPGSISTPTPEAIENIKVYVTGCVNNPGIVTIKKGQIIEDALNQAGGVTDDADVNSINRVYKLKENVMIYIKSKSEQQKLVDQNIEKSWSQSQDAGPGVDIITDSGGSILSGTAIKGVQKTININTATDAELDTLPGIGKETAKTIIEFRNKNGDFKDTKDIMKIPGIKESKYNSIKDLISVD